MEFGHLLVGLVVITRSICGIVLHSDVDLATEILLLKQRVAQLEARPVPQGNYLFIYSRTSVARTPLGS